MSGKSAVVMNCPECGCREAHPVELTISVKDSSSLPPVAGCSLPSDLLGLRTPIYRVRVKRCVKCHKDFETAEMPLNYFYALQRENERLKAVEKSSAEDRQQLEVLTSKLKKISEIVTEGNIVKRPKVLSLFGDSSP